MDVNNGVDGQTDTNSISNYYGNREGISNDAAGHHENNLIPSDSGQNGGNFYNPFVPNPGKTFFGFRRILSDIDDGSNQRIHDPWNVASEIPGRHGSDDGNTGVSSIEFPSNVKLKDAIYTDDQSRPEPSSTIEEESNEGAPDRTTGVLTTILIHPNVSQIRDETDQLNPGLYDNMTHFKIDDNWDLSKVVGHYWAPVDAAFPLVDRIGAEVVRGHFEGDNFIGN